MSKRLKNLILIATVMCMGVTVEPVYNVKAVEKVKAFNEVGNIEKFADNLKYVDNGESITITGYTGYGSSVTIPEVIDGKKVTKIDDDTFKWHGELQEIKLPSTLEAIGNSSFENCGSLSKIVIPDSVTSIGNSAFSYCSSLKEIVMPKLLSTIGELAFQNCTTIKEIVVPDNVTIIGKSAFYNCCSMTKITLPKSLKDISDSTFAFCRSLRDVNIPKGVKTIGNEAFYSCDSLKELEIPSTVGSTGNNAFMYDGNLLKVTIYNKNMNIVDGSMSGTSELTIYGYKNSTAESFANKSNFKFVPLEGEPEEINPDEEDSIFKYEEFNHAVRIYGVKDKIKELEIPETIKGKVVNTIKTAAFMGNKNITKVKIPENMRMVGSSSFRNCTNLVSVTIPEYVEYIGENAFKGCDNLTMYGYEGSYAEDYAKANNIKFVSLGKCTKQFLVEEHVHSIKITGVEGTYYNMEIPKKIKGKTVTTIGTAAFKGNKTLTTVEVPDTVTTIGSFSFENCSNLSMVEIPDSVTYIGKAAFNNCKRLIIYGFEGSYAQKYAVENNIKFIVIKDPVKYFSYEDFVYTAKITAFKGHVSKLEIPEKVKNRVVTTIGTAAFRGNKEITSAIIPNTVITIGGQSFANCENLTQINIPREVTYIGTDAFKGCKSLVIYGEENSYAEKYSKENNIKFIAE